MCLACSLGQAFEKKVDLDVDALEAREYDEDDDASLLRFLVDMKGEAVDGKQLRDDLMTMLVRAPHTLLHEWAGITFE